jgi:WD40 repeat protein
MRKVNPSFGHIQAILITLVTLLTLGPVRAQDRAKIEIVPFLGHSHVVKSVAFSPDGARVLSGSYDKSLMLWDVATGKLIRTFGGHSGFVLAVAFSPDGARVLSGSFDRSLKLWDVATGALIRTFKGHSKAVNSVAFSPDGARVLSGSDDDSLKLWDVATGKLIRTFEGQSTTVYSVAFSPGGRSALSGTGEGTLKMWDVATGKLIRTFVGHSRTVTSVAFSPDGARVLSGSHDNSLKLWDTVTGALIHTFEAQSGWVGWAPTVNSVAFSPDGNRVLSGSGELWDVTTGKLIRTFGGPANWVYSVAFSPDGARVLSGSDDNSLELWDAATGALVHTFKGHSEHVNSVAFSPDGARVLSGSDDKLLKLWDVATVALIRTFEGHSRTVTSVAFSPDGARVLSGSDDNSLKLWDAATGTLIRTFEGHSRTITSVAFSPDGARVLSNSDDKSLKLRDAATGALVHTFEGHSKAVRAVAFSPEGTRVLSGSDDKSLKLWDAATGALVHTLEGHSDLVEAVAFSPDGSRILSGSKDKALKLWDAATGALIRTFEGHSGGVTSVAFSPDGTRVLSGSEDATVRIWDLTTGQLLVRLLAGRDGEWLAMTPQGFFVASREGANILSIVRGLGVTTVNQVHQSLFSPDLVREALAGDPNNEVREAGEVINLEKVVDSGPAPAVAITSHFGDGTTAEDLVTLQGRITDGGKGIGRIEWRVNGLTSAVSSAPADHSKEYVVAQQLALDPGDNTIELIAYNANNLLASLPARTTIKFTGPADKAKPKLHVLAIGINAYVDRGWRQPGSGDTLAFPPLHLAVNDAKALAASMQLAGAGQYAEVKVTEALDTDATATGLEKIIERMASDIHPRDTFVLFAAAHGTSRRGHFYLIPQDYNGGPNPAALEERAIDQGRLQDWVANRIKAKKAILLLDTCESGALVGGYTRSRTDVPASEAAIGRLHEATGRPVLTAAAEGKPAFEGYEGHGVFTWTLLDALKNGDRNGDGLIELSELVAHVQEQVPKIAAQLNGRGRAAVAARGSTDDRQTAHFGSRGEDFVLARRLQ